MKHSIIIVLLAGAGLAACAQMQIGQSQQACANPPAVRRDDVDRVRDVVDKRVALGMTTCEVLAVWGVPDGVSETTGYREETSTIYFYRSHPTSTSATVRFTNGRVDSIQ